MKSVLAAPQFDVAGEVVSVLPIPGGIVNDTYRVICRNAAAENHFILQRINKRVFKAPGDVVANMKVVTEHVLCRLSTDVSDEMQRWQCPRVIPALNGDDLIIDDDGDFWRAISPIRAAHAYEHVRSLKHAQEAGYVLGVFQRLISDIPIDRLIDTLPGFHVTPLYLEKYDEAAATEVGEACLTASTDCATCAAFIAERRDWASVLEDAREAGQLQVRPIHGDPKVANIMIADGSGLGVGIIDLDTVKPGLVHYDFGDCLRSVCNPAGEDPSDRADVMFDVSLCESVVNGYMTAAAPFLTDDEIALLYDSIRLMTFELGIRFFTDFLSGNTYFKAVDEKQNLRRAIVQFELCKSIEEREADIRRILERARKAS